MAGRKGCFKSCLVGCGVIVALLVVGGAILAGLAWRSLNSGAPASGDLHFDTGASAAAVAEPMSERAARLTTTRGGTVRLALGQGEFRLLAAAAGEGLHASAEFDAEVHHISEQFAVLPDSTWEYNLEFRRTMPGAQSFFRRLFGGAADAKVTVYLPPEVPIDLLVRAQDGGCEADLGGLWLRNGDLRFQRGGIEIEFSSALREPMDSLLLNTRMGGAVANRIGNASPRMLDIDCAMGGANIDLRGAWRGDCDARAAIRMGGMNLRVPADMRVDGADVPPRLLSESAGEEVPGPVLRLTIEKSMGEIEVRR